MRFAVVVCDPSMSRDYGFVIEHEEVEAAKREAVQRAIIADPRGCGAGTADQFPLPEEVRREQADSTDLVDLMARAYVTAAEFVA